MDIKADGLLEWKSNDSIVKLDGRENSVAPGNTFSSVESSIETSSVAKDRQIIHLSDRKERNEMN
jgi:hypothetical protein